MLTAGISAIVVAILHALGIRPSAAQIAGIVIAVKVVIVVAGALVALRVSRRRRAAAAAVTETPAADAAKPVDRV